MSLNPSITKLSEKWYEYISSGLHDDEDCHWKIEIDFAYGGKPTYRASFGNYVEPARNRLVKAQEDLYNLIQEHVNSEKEWAESVQVHSDEYTDEQVARASKCKEIFDNDA